MFTNGTIVKHWSLKKTCRIENIRIEISRESGNYVALVDLVDVHTDERSILPFWMFEEEVQRSIFYLPEQELMIQRYWEAMRSKYSVEIPLVRNKYNPGRAGYLECESNTCSHKRDCAQHKTAGDFRSESGDTPNIKLVDDKYMCCQQTTNGGGMLSPSQIVPLY